VEDTFDNGVMIMAWRGQAFFAIKEKYTQFMIGYGCYTMTIAVPTRLPDGEITSNDHQHLA
jgi:hypothetical protein